jgi:hypothetical protein
MARPRVFVSSTYYDLKHLRSSLENFVESLGFDAILSEKGKIAYTPDIPLDESCYREVGNTDIFVLIVGGRYGSEASSGKISLTKTFYERYNSITRGEYRAAVDRDIPIYVLIERSVYAEYETYLKNKANKNISYAHVDSVNIFGLIEDVLGQPRNNPIQQFDRYSEIEAWLREQWAGLFRELLQRIQSQAQIASLQAQVATLADLNTTFKRYLEEIVSKIAPAKSKTLIRTETKRLADAARNKIVMANPLADYLRERFSIPTELIRRSATESNTLETFFNNLAVHNPNKALIEEINRLSKTEVRPSVIADLNKLRKSLDVPPLPLDTVDTAPNTEPLQEISHTSMEQGVKAPIKRKRAKKKSKR